MTAPAAAPSRGYIARAGKSDWRTALDVLGLIRAMWGRPPDLDPCAHLYGLVDAAVEIMARDDAPPPVGACRIVDTDGRTVVFGDGLAEPWEAETVFVNPPFDELAAWVEKGEGEYRAGRAREIVFLLPSRTDTAYWHDHLSSAALLCFWRGRLRFVGAPAPCPFPVTFAYWGPRAVLFRAAFKERGMVVAP